MILALGVVNDVNSTYFTSGFLHVGGGGGGKSRLTRENNKIVEEGIQE